MDNGVPECRALPCIHCKHEQSEKKAWCRRDVKSVAASSRTTIEFDEVVRVRTWSLHGQ
jgi:hypothetical protein